MEKVKRPLLLTGLILNIIVYSIFLGLGLVFTSQVIYYSFIRIGELIVFVFLLFLILLIIFSSIGLSVSSKRYELFRRKSGFILLTIIFTCILDIIGVFIIFYIDLFNILILFLLLMSVIGTIFTLIGFAKGMQYYEVDYTLINKVNNQTDSFDDALIKVEKLKKLKEQEIISDEEYQILKQKQIDILRK